MRIMLMSLRDDVYRKVLSGEKIYEHRKVFPDEPVKTYIYYGAHVVNLVLADGSASTYVEDGSCVLENMMLAAHALGLGTVWVHREREIFDSESGKALLREWKLPETLRGVGAIALGYPAQESGQPAARKQNYIVRTICGEEGKYADQ